MSIFAAAKTIAPKKPAKAAKDEIQMPGLGMVAKIDSLIKTLGALQTTLTKEIKDTASVIFFDSVKETGRKPDSFRGIDGDASGSIEFRKRGTNSPLQPDEVDLLERFGLKVTDSIITQEMYGFNPAYNQDAAMFDMISAALEPLITSGKLPADLIVKQDQVSKKVVTDEMLETACRMKDKLPTEVLSTLSTLAIKPKLESTDIVAIFSEVQELFVPSEPEVVTGATITKV